MSSFIGLHLIVLNRYHVFVVSFLQTEGLQQPSIEEVYWYCFYNRI